MEKIIYRKSLTAKLVLNQPTIEVYQQIKDICATRKDVTTRLSFGKETVSYLKTKVAVIKVVRKNIALYLALDPAKYVNLNFHMKDVSQTIEGFNYPTAILLDNQKNINHALKLLETALSKAHAKELCVAELIDYKEVFYERSFEKLLEEGHIKKYVRVGEELIELCNVHITANLLYDATDQAKKLYIITNYNNWNLKEAVLMKKVADNRFEATLSLPKHTMLEFKICRSTHWEDVEKGIWKEEIVNHQYVLVDEDLEIEDLIYNFREEN
ncbi:MAG: hypothetical protein K2H02_01650 [Anaeroplasmataceae bacterium]|nr:hypothetical protein [Anaeroplasmataceae bacterium]